VLALHRKREEVAQAEARQLLVSTEPVELPSAVINEQGVSVERAEFGQYLPELFAALRVGGLVEPVPIVQSDSLFIVNGVTRAFWVRLWHADQARSHIVRARVLNCVPLVPNVRINLGV
jgi:hypothetical protein